MISGMPKTFLSLIYILTAMLSIQFGASVAKKIFPLAGPAGTSMLRVNFAALMLFLMWRPWKISWSKKQLLTFFYYGASLGLMNLTFYIALERIPLGIAVALEFTGPLTLSLLSSRKWTDLLWAVLAALGIWFILPVTSLQTGGQTALDPWGIFFAVLAGVFWALYIIFGKASGKEVHSGHATSWGMLFAGLVIIPFGIFMNGSQVFNETFFSDLFLISLVIAVLSSALPYSLEMMAMKNIPSKTFGILMSMEPAVASLMGLLFLTEKLTLLQTAGIFCIILASAGTTWSATMGRKSEANLYP